MALWLLFAFIMTSATIILALTFGPLKTAANVRSLRAIAFVQYAAALALAGARLAGMA